MRRKSEKPWFESWHDQGIFLYSKASRPLLEPIQSHIRLIEGFLSSGVKRCGSEANDSPPSSTKVQNKDSYPAVLPHAGKEFHRDTFDFTIYNTTLHKTAYRVVI